ncbi:MAG: protein translocase subunit SecF [Candidatus Nanohalobium sp.]
MAECLKGFHDRAFFVNAEKYFNRVYEDYDKFLVVPLVMFILAIGVLGFTYITTGQLVEKGTAFSGGSEIQFKVKGDFNTNNIAKAFESAGRPNAEALSQRSGNQTLAIVQLPPPTIQDDEAEQIMGNAGYNATVVSLRTISASVSKQFFLQAQIAFVLAFMTMSLVIFIAFKDLTPSLAVIAAALGDIVFGMAGMAALGIPLTLGSLAALLMLIGYSVDTDIVLSTRVLKRNRGSLKSRIWSSVKTGTTMSMGGIAGFTLLYTISYMIVGSSELSNISAVMVIGLLADMPFTWLGNAIILKKYVNGDLEFLSKYGEKVEEVVPWI